jgi:hypothetical protein
MANKTFYFSPVKYIIGVKANLKNFSFSYGMAMPLATKKEYDNSIIKIEVEVVSGTVVPQEEEKEKMGKFHYFNGYPEQGEIFYERSFLFSQKLQYKISGIDSNNIKVTVNKNYFKFVKHRFMNIHSIGYILTDIINLRLLHNGMAPLHCSGFVKDNDCYVIFAPPNTGKTLTAMTLCMKKDAGYNFIAEDLAVSNAKDVFAVPWTSTFRYYDSVDSSRFSKGLNNLTEKISFLELFSFGKTDPITKYVQEVIHKAKLKGIYILDRGDQFIKDIPLEDAFDRINTLDRYEFNYMRAPAIIAYEYFNRKTDIEKAYSEERRILKEMVSNADFVKVVSTDNALNYSKMIDSDLGNAK